MPRPARTPRRCQWSWLFANSPGNLSQTELGRVDATESHLRIPAEYHRRPREQREAGDSGRGRYEGRIARGGYGVGSRWGGRKKEKRKRGGEKLDGRIRKRVHRLGRLFVPVSYVLYLGPYLFQPHRCTLALCTPLSTLVLPWLSRNSSK